MLSQEVRHLSIAAWLINDQEPETENSCCGMQLYFCSFFCKKKLFRKNNKQKST